MPDYYEVLQVHPRAESEVIRAAYRTLARKYHPDLGGDPSRMIALNDAWDVLGDPARRAAYDASRARSGAQTTVAPAGGTAARPEPGAQHAPEAASAAPRAEAARGTSSDVVHAGPPPGRPSGTVLDFGRYAGWSLGEIARYDLDYLEWLQRATFGRRLRAEIDLLLAGRRGSRAAARPTSGRGWPGRG
jgi:curved DNA-binding protein CbpA